VDEASHTSIVRFATPRRKFDVNLPQPSVMLSACHLLLQLARGGYDGFRCRCPNRPTDPWIFHVCRKPGCGERGQDISFRRRERPPWIDWHGSSSGYPRQPSTVVDHAEKNERDDGPMCEHAEVTEKWQRNLSDRVALYVKACADGVVGK
jgi:hypothetical protein